MDHAASSDSIRFLLRQGTRTEHAVLDQHPDFAALVEGRLGLEAYGELMRRMHALYRAVDGPVGRACAAHDLDSYGFVYVPRTPLLARDLGALGLSAEPGAFDASAVPVKTPWTLAGALYVIEGSVLGGSMLSAATRKLLRGAGSEGNGYWLWCRREGAARWAATCRLLDAMATGDEAREGMISGARAMFALFAACLDPDRHPRGKETASSC